MTEENREENTSKEPIVFWIMQFGTKNFKLFDECALRLPKYQFIHAASQPNLRAFQADIIENIIRADYIIADVSDKNLNVMLELGIAEAFNKKTITIAKEIDLPSDITQYRAIPYSVEFNGIEKLCADIDEIISRDLQGEIKFSNLVKDNTPAGFVQIISEAVQFCCQNSGEDFYRKFIEAQAAKLGILSSLPVPFPTPTQTPLPHEILLLLALADSDKDDGFRVFYTLPFGEKDFGNYVISAAGKFYNKQPKEANHKQTTHWKDIVELALREKLFVKDDPTTSYIYPDLEEKVDIMERIHLYKTFDLFRLASEGYKAVEELKRQEERGEKDYVLYRSTP